MVDHTFRKATTRNLPASKELAEFSRLADAYVEKATVSQKSAVKTLNKIGTHTSKGKLTKAYK